MQRCNVTYALPSLQYCIAVHNVCHLEGGTAMDATARCREMGHEFDSFRDRAFATFDIEVAET